MRHADNQPERLPALAEELVRLKVDVILAASVNAAQAVKNATKTIPVVFVSTADLVVAGLVRSIARHGENLTGFTTVAQLLSGKRLELLKETAPAISRIAALWNPNNRFPRKSGKRVFLRRETLDCKSIQWKLPE